MWAQGHASSPASVKVTGTGLATNLYCRHHGNERLRLTIEGNHFYAQPFRLAGIRPEPKVAFLDVLATRGANTLYLHVINRDPDRVHTVDLDLLGFERGPSTIVRHSLVPKPEADWRHHRFDRSKLQEVPAGDFSAGGSMTLEVPARSANVFAIGLKSG